MNGVAADPSAPPGAGCGKSRPRTWRDELLRGVGHGSGFVGRIHCLRRFGLRRPAKEGECGTSCLVDVPFRVTLPQGSQGAGRQAVRCDCRSGQSLCHGTKCLDCSAVITLRDVYLKFTCVWDGHPDGDWSEGCCQSRALMGLSDLFPTPT